MDIDKKKMAAIETVMNQIEKQYGKGSIVKLGSNKTLDIESIPTGSLALDIALGIGGVPKGKNNRNIWTRIVMARQLYH